VPAVHDRVSHDGILYEFNVDGSDGFIEEDVGRAIMLNERESEARLRRRGCWREYEDEEEEETLNLLGRMSVIVKKWWARRRK